MLLEINFSSIILSITSISFEFPLNFISSNETLFISLISRLSIGGTICPPSFQYTLYPLYSGGLCEAVKTIPQVQPSSFTAKDNSGVGLNSLKTYALILFAENTSDTILAK